MTSTTKYEIPKEIYNRAVENRGFVTEEDKESVWSVAQLYGYGVYSGHVYEENGKYYVPFSMGDSCD